MGEDREGRGGRQTKNKPSRNIFRIRNKMNKGGLTNFHFFILFYFLFKKKKEKRIKEEL